MRFLVSNCFCDNSSVHEPGAQHVRVHSKLPSSPIPIVVLNSLNQIAVFLLFLVIEGVQQATLRTVYITLKGLPS